MAQLDERMKLIGDAILTQARQEARELIDKANAIRDEEIAKCEDEIITMMFSKVQSKANTLRHDSVKGVALAELEARRILLKHRDEKKAAVFGAVTQRLIQHRDTPEYKKEILEKITGLKSDFDHAFSIVYLNGADMGLSDEIKKILGKDVRVEKDAHIKIGGFKLKNTKSRKLVDETLDERLNGQTLWFLQVCGLKVM